MNRIALIAAVLLVAGGCGRSVRNDPQAIPNEVAIEALRPAVQGKASTAETQVQASGTVVKEKSSFDLDKVLSSPWLIAAVFLLIQWFEIWYYNRTGRKSATIDAAEAAMAPKLGILQRVLYRIWRWAYFWKHKDKRDPDKEEEETK